MNRVGIFRNHPSVGLGIWPILKSALYTYDVAEARRCDGNRSPLGRSSPLGGPFSPPHRPQQDLRLTVR
jgi:hypothetical protein